MDDKQVLIIPSLDDFELEPSDSPYCTTTTALNFSRDPNSSYLHNKIHSSPNVKNSRGQKFRLFGNRNSISERISTISNNFHNISSNTPRSTTGAEDIPQRLNRSVKFAKDVFQFHWRMIVGSVLTVISSAGCLISFPLHLETVTGDEGSDGFSACFAISTILVVLFLLSSFGVKIVYWASTKFEGNGVFEDDDYFQEMEATVIKPRISWKNILKIGFSVGLSLLTLCSSWEDHKVACNFQDSLLGLVIIFAVITHAVSKWRHFGFKRAFSLLGVVAGVFVSVNYMLLDERKCRGHLYAHPPKDNWSWKVHLVWTLAFVIAIWLWTVAMFCLESAIPFPTIRRRRPEENNAVKMTILRVKPTDGQALSHLEDAEVTSEDPEYFLANNNNYGSSSGRRNSPVYYNPYSKISYVTVFNSVLWFQVSTWGFIASLFWTEFIPGFGIGKGPAEPPSFPSAVWSSFDKCFHDGCSWWLIISIFVFSQSFTYLIFLIRSSLIAVCVSCLGFPIIGLWWSFFQISQNVFVWMPVYSGELFCSMLGLPLIFFGTLYIFKLDILNPNRIAVAV
ncbi:unnamed protein product [Allacma fusca]|uniref:Uncharacterized protein n=1 Tax=Allacma fusca TaxID=39272 RepID=A0A8J2P7J6_9HEXA|nr:unnamed protein product [Allacma fusca]